MRAALLLSSIILLAGCANLQKLKDANPATEDFYGALAAEYRGYSESESEQHHPLNAEYYAGKGLKALNGGPVEPEAPDAGLPAPLQAELNEAHAQLLLVLNDNMKRIAPQKLAHGQLLYDCWQHQAARGMSTEKVPCAEEFRSTLVELQEINDTFLYSQTFTHVIEFTGNSDRMGKNAPAAIRQAVREAGNTHDYVTEIIAHPGAGKSGHILADKRLAAVQKALVKGGMSAAHIRPITKDDTKKVYLNGKAPRPQNTIGVTVKIRRPEDTP